MSCSHRRFGALTAGKYEREDGLRVKKRDMLDENRIKELLALVGVSTRLVFFDRTDSTNDRAREWAKNAYTGECVAFLAREQTKGRGRRGRSFLSENGGIYLTILTVPNKNTGFERITAEAAVRVARVVEELTGLSVGIKWVNDLYINGRKCAGILTEGEFDENGNLAYYALGLGINVYKIDRFSSKIPIATTLEDEIIGENARGNAEASLPDINLLCARIIAALLSADTPGVSDYRERCILLGKRVIIKRGDEQIFAVALDILDDYSLLVENERGERVVFNSGEVSTVFDTGSK